MVHALIIGAVLTGAIVRATKFGKIAHHAKLGVKVVEELKAIGVIVLQEKLRRIKHQMDLGLNSAEDAHYFETYGEVPVLFPAKVRVEDLPDRFETVFKVKVAGEYLFKVSEWNELWDWILQTMQRQNILQTMGQKSGQEARPDAKAEAKDGRWLLLAGRRRWEDEALRVKAFENSVRFAEFWHKVEMWEEKDS